MSDFTTDFVLEVTAKLLNIIYAPQEPFSQHVKAPASMSARYKMGSKLAELCQNLGFQDLGYHTFLYSNESDLRSLFMFLIDKLPKDNDIDKDFEPSEISTREKISQAMKLASNDECQKVQETHQEAFSAWDVTEMTDDELFKLLPKETRAAALDAKIKLNSLIQVCDI